MSNSVDINNMVWSYSRLDAFCKCKYSWFLNYIEHKPQIQNGFSLYGTMVHSILENWAKGVILQHELAEEYFRQYYQCMTLPIPRMGQNDLNPKYFQRGLDYFLNFRGFGEKEIITSEYDFVYSYKGLRWRSIIDLLVKDDQDKVFLIDFKIWADSKTNTYMKEHFRQQYLYCIALWKFLKIVPDSIILEFPVRGDCYIEKFDSKRFHESEDWAFQTLDEISKETEWAPTVDKTFCQCICGYREICEHCPKKEIKEMKNG
jgi:hypothetical protein